MRPTSFPTPSRSLSRLSDLGIITAAIQLDPSLWQSNMLGTIDPVRGVQEVNGYVQAFFDLTLKGMPSPLLEGPRRSTRIL